MRTLRKHLKNFCPSVAAMSFEIDREEKKRHEVSSDKQQVTMTILSYCR